MITLKILIYWSFNLCQDILWWLLQSIVKVAFMSNSFKKLFEECFHSTAFKGCTGIVFTHGVQMGGWAVGKSLSRLYLRNHEVYDLILGRDICWKGLGMQHHGVTLF